MLGHLKSELRASLNFPGPPAIAQQIIALARDPHTDISQVAATIARDPALAAKLLRAANSALYSRQRKSSNLRQGLIVLGLQGATTLAISFSLLAAYMDLTTSGVDRDRYWRRAILGASAARGFGVLRSASAVDEIFLAALLQDIAILGVDRATPDFYRELPRNASHHELSGYETERLGIDHAELGAWLLEYWRLPEPLCRSVASSHAPESTDGSTPSGMAGRCIALGSECADILLASASVADVAALAEHASDWLGIDAPALAEAMARIVAELPEIEHLFATTLLPPGTARVILEQAREQLKRRHLSAPGPLGSAPARTPNLEVHAVALPDDQGRDRLTGLFNRGYLDLMLRREFHAATSGHWPLSVVFVDLDRFKAINDAHGHEAGDSVLVTTARSIESVARDTDCVARYGGTEFVIVLPGLSSPGAEIFCERLIDGLRCTSHRIGDAVVTVTASVGLAIHSPEKPFQRASHLINAAERSAYFAKISGRDRVVQHKSGRPVSVAKV